MQSNYKTLKSNTSALASKVKDITYARSKSARMDNYGLLGDSLGVNKYYKLTGISTYAIPAEPALYDPSMNYLMPTHKQKCRLVFILCGTVCCKKICLWY